MDHFLAENLRRAEVFSASVEAIARLQHVCAEMRDAYATAGPRGLARYMLEQMPRVEGGSASVQRAILCAGAGDLDSAFEHLDSALEGHDPRSSISPWRRNGTACASTPGSICAWHEWGWRPQAALTSDR
jgi:hypothetical protein